jgi:hypothetical protein
MEQPNIFDYATSELSQDAFICYLLAFGKEKYKNDFPKEYAVAHKFLEKCGIAENEEILEIKKQYLNIDVLVVTSHCLLIVEDKTYTNEHDDQIVRYVQTIRNHNDEVTANKTIKVCYLKTMDYVHAYESSNTTILPQCDCCSLRRKDMMDLLEMNPQNNLIFESFYRRLDNIEKLIKNCDDTEIKMWSKEKWFAFLSSALDGRQFDIKWVNNPKGGLYVCYFDWVNCGDGENYKQIEISFDDCVTSEVRCCFKFSTTDKDKTINDKPLIKELQQQVISQDYNASNRIGRTTTYAYHVAKTLDDVTRFINNAS